MHNYTESLNTAGQPINRQEHAKGIQLQSVAIIDRNIQRFSNYAATPIYSLSRHVTIQDKIT